MGPVGSQHGAGPHYVICGRDRAKLGAFSRPSFQVARCGNHNGAVVNPDSGRPIVFDDERLLRDDFDRHERFAETLELVALCGGDRVKPRRPLYSPLWQVDGSRIRRYAPIELLAATCPIFSNLGSRMKYTKRKLPTLRRGTPWAHWRVQSTKRSS